MAVVVSIWINRYSFCYSYYLWRLDNTTEGTEVEIIFRIRAMAEHIVPLLEKTYEDTNNSKTVRGSAASALIRFDRWRAEEIFLQFLYNDNEDIVAQAIYDLGRNESKYAYWSVLKYLTSPNKEIRSAVVSYLTEVNMPNSVILLKQIKENDPSKDVQIKATYGLQSLGILPLK